MSARARSQLSDVLGWVNGANLDEASYRTRFSSEFVSQFPYAKFAGIVASLRGQQPWQSTSTDETVKLVGHWQRAEEKLRVTLIPDSRDPARIGGLLFAQDAPDPAAVTSPPATSGAAVERLRALGKLSLLVASTARGKCEPLVQVEPELAQPVGSVFKLWVLAAVVKKVRAGELRWTDPVTIQDALDSLPTGVTQDDPDGSTRSVRELAERMIAISDNTATDHLIARVGRSAVEKVMAEHGHAHPEVNRPFLSTRDMFVLKLGADEALQKEYLAGNEAARRKLLDTRVRSAALPELEAVKRKLAAGPTLIREIEWLGSMLDVCRLLVALTKDEAASKILGMNPGVAAAPGRWSYIGFKGGSETGVLAMAWEHEAASGERYVTAAALSNNEAAIPEAEAVRLMATIRDFTR
jgi:beta-lactamase class A